MNIKVIDKRQGFIFIPSEIDDLGLDPIAFRVYVRVSRGLDDGIETIASACQLREADVTRSLNHLVKLGVISVADNTWSVNK